MTFQETKVCWGSKPDSEIASESRSERLEGEKFPVDPPRTTDALEDCGLNSLTQVAMKYFQAIKAQNHHTL